MIINNEILKEKVKYLGLAISKDNTALQNTKMIRFSSSGNSVYAYTFDGTNNIKVYIGDCDDNFYAIVDYNIFNNFIKSCEGDITLETTDKSLNIKASNVKCKIPIFNDTTKTKDAGIPDPKCDFSTSKELKINFKLNTLKSILDTNHIVEAYRQIYFGDVIMVSDTDNVLIIENKVFDRNVTLDLSSVEILNSISNIKYSFINDGSINKLCITSNELDASIILKDSTDFQYDDLMDLFDNIVGTSIIIDSNILSKAIATSQIFKINPNIIFNNKGIFLEIKSVGFIYKISDTTCSNRIFELDQNIVKKINVLGSDVIIYYTNNDLIKCVVDGMSMILSVKDVKLNE